MRFFVLMTCSMIISTAFAAKDCVITIDRTPCSKAVEVEVWKPYGGKNPAPKEFNAKNENECKKIALEEECPIVRTGKIMEKKATAKYKGKDIDSAANLCAKVEKARAPKECKG